MGMIRSPTGYMGVLPHQVGLGSNDININGSAVRAGFTWLQPADKTLSSLTVWADSITGSPTGGCEIFAMGANGFPTGAALADSTTHSPNPITAGTLTFSGYSLSLTGGNLYVASVRNTHGTPASNAFRCPTAQTGGNPSFGLGMTGTVQWNSISSTDSGSSWTGLTAGSTCLSLIFNDSDTVGWPFRGQWNTGTSDAVYGARELGLRMTTPAGAALRVIGLCFHTRTHTGTPTGFLRPRIRLSSDNSIVATGYDIDPVVTMTGNGRVTLLFTGVVELAASTQYDFLISETTQSDTSSNRYNFEGTTIQAGVAVVPWSAQKIYFDGTSTWTATNTQVVHMGVLLDEQQSTAGGSGGLPWFVNGGFAR